MKICKSQYVVVVLMQGIAITSSGQDILSWRQNSYRDGDSLVKARTAKVTAGERGRDRVWHYDTSGMTAEYVMKYRQMSDTTVCTEHDTKYYYRQQMTAFCSAALRTDCQS